MKKQVSFKRYVGSSAQRTGAPTGPKSMAEVVLTMRRQTSDGGYIVAGDTDSHGAGGSDFRVLRS